MRVQVPGPQVYALVPNRVRLDPAYIDASALWDGADVFSKGYKGSGL